MTRRALVIGGTGPSGPHVVNGSRRSRLRDRDPPQWQPRAAGDPDVVEHIHTDAYDPDKVRAALGDRTFDVCIATYGRLRANAEITAGRVGQFISVGGFPGYRGYMNAPLFDPAGLPDPDP